METIVKILFLAAALTAAASVQAAPPSIDGVADVPMTEFVEPGARYFARPMDDGLYVYVETAADGITARDRGYQNGDGVIMTIGWPRKDGSPTDEFHVLGFSAGAAGQWYEKIRWYYNTDLSFERLGDDVQFASVAKDGVAGFEIFVPWSSVYPYSPRFFKRIGFNLCFVKAEGAKSYFLKPDERMQWEQSPREYVLLDLEGVPPFDARAAMGKAGDDPTLRFHAQELARRWADLESYESARGLLPLADEFERLASAPASEWRGTYRRAYEFGGELFPYSIHVPEEYSPTKKYPLMVWLHGSGEDDRALANAFKPDGFIVVAPSGRNVSNCFATVEAQEDIRRAVEDARRSFRLTDRTVLSGFSMGGYGVYRTFWETPEKYDALAVFSGHPDLAREWTGEGVDFTQAANLSRFRRVPMFIYHSPDDVNCPFALTEDVVEKLHAQGANVTFVVGEGGHGGTEEDVRKKYEEWLWR